MVTEDTENPRLVILDCGNKGVRAVFTEKKGDSAPVKNTVANIITGLRYSKIVIKLDQEPAIRSTERNVVESLFEHEIKDLCGCQHSSVGESAASVDDSTDKAEQSN